MRKIDEEKIGIYLASILLLALLTPLLSKLPRTRGKNPLFHVAYAVAVIAMLMLLPEFIQDEIFSPGGVVVVGTLLPVYQSIVAVCTPGEADDAIWLQYWIASGTLSYCTEFVDEIKQWFPEGGEHWYEFEFFVILWLMLPFTDGATLIHDTFTEPKIAPIAKSVKAKCETWFSVILTLVNSWHLWIVWFVFMSFNEEEKRFVVIAVGTIYPLAASMVALTTKTDGSDETFWLTYWACFSLLFLAMDYLENFIGSVPGFYSICLVATVYLFLPMFDGAETVFRRILVPLSGQYENLLLHDAYLIRRQVEKSIPQQYHDRVLQKAADVFTKPKDKLN